MDYSPTGSVAQTGAAGFEQPPDRASRLWFSRDGKPTAISVQLGLDDGAYTKVRKGDLQPGDELIIGESDGALGKTPAPRRM